MSIRFELRVADTTDVADVALLHAESWRQAYRGMLRDEYLDHQIYSERESLWRRRFREAPGNQHVLIARADKVPVGFACTYGGEDVKLGSFLDNLHVLPEYKRQGIGAGLMRQTADWCERYYPDKGMYLWVLESNTSAIRFYERMGGSMDGEGVWTPPDGGEYRKFRYVWRTLRGLTRRI